MVYDPDIGGTILFGGNGPNTNSFGDTWVYYASSQAWLQVFPHNSPAPRAYAAMAYDASDHMVILFGGYGANEVYGDTWGLNFTGSTPEWYNLTPSIVTATDSPSPRLYSSMTQGPSAGVFLYGGDSYIQNTWVTLGDSWNFSRSTGWREICEQGSCGPTLPGPLAASTLSYSILLAGDVLFGGFDGSGILNVTWVFNSTGWWNITDLLYPNPAGRFFATLEPEGGFLLLCGGAGATGILRDCDQLDPITPRWTVATSLTFGTYLAAEAYDPVAGEPFLYGGVNGSFGIQDILWGFGGVTWAAQYPSAGNHPADSWETNMVYDAADGYVVDFSPGTNSHFPTTWTYLAGNWTNITPALPGPSNSPSARLSFAMAYDAVDSEVILFGGYELSTSNFLSDTWAFRAGSWTNITTGTSPPSLESAALAPATPGGPLLLFGGYDPTTLYSGATWEFSAGTWTKLSPAMSPGVRDAAAMTYDPMIGGVLLFGGYNSVGILDDTWKFDAKNTTWVALCSPACSGSNPNSLFNPSLAFDYRDNLTILIGGDTGENWIFLNDNWYFIYWSDPAPSPRQGTLMTWDGSTQDGYLLLWGGYYSAIGRLFDAWTVAPQLRATTPTLSKNSLDAGQQSLSISAPARGGGAGNPSEHWENLPPGCTVSVGAVLNCTPTAPGPYAIFNLVTTANGIPSVTGNVTHLNVDPSLVQATVPQASRSSADVGTTVEFFANATGGSGTYATSWHGLSADPCSGAGFAYNCTFVALGNLSVSETVVDGNGLALTTGTLNFPVFAPLQVSAPVISPEPVLAGSPLSLLDIVTGGSGTNAYLWQGLPTGCASHDAPTFNCTPTTPGNYSVTLAVTDSSGVNITSAPTAVTVFGVPTANLSISASASLTQGSSPLLVAFNASSQGGSGAVAYRWAFGDGGFGAGSVVQHTYTTYGTFRATVWANDSLGRSANHSFSISVSPSPLTAYLGILPARILLGQNATFNITAGGGTAPYQYTWQGLPSGCSLPTGAFLRCSPSAAGTFDVKVIVKDGQGSTVTAAQTLTVLSTPSGSPSSSSSVSDWPLLAALVLALIALGVVLLRWVLGRPRTPQTPKAEPSPSSPPGPPPSTTVPSSPPPPATTPAAQPPASEASPMEPERPSLPTPPGNP